jgi:hypothetical protein
MAGQIISGGIDIANSIIGSKKRKAEQLQAQGLYDSSMNDFRNLDTSNPYANMENTMEDLTVNTQAADFTAQQQNQGLSNIMGSMKQAAGGSGVAALAQSLANQQSQNAQSASASIGQQEASNQAAAAQQAGANQKMSREGDYLSQQMERGQTETELGMAQGRLGAANQARIDATQSLVSGIGQVAGGIAGGPIGAMLMPTPK